MNMIRRWLNRKNIKKLDRLPKLEFPSLIEDVDYDYRVLKNKERFK